jgi:MFS family permease
MNAELASKDGAQAAAGAQGPTETDSWPAQRLAWLTVGCLTVVQFLSAIDRHLINLLIGPIKQDLGISDSRMGLLALSFAVLYAAMGLVAGRGADSLPRKALIALGTAVWSVMTIAFGLARTLGQLFVTRMGVGAGEATLNPNGYSLIADYFPPQQRAKPMGIFIMGNTLGQAFTLFAGGALIQYLMKNHITWALPWGGELKPWQIAFVCAGAPGFLVTLLVLTIREPRRREMLEIRSRAGVALRPRRISLLEVGRYFVRHLRLYVPVFLGFGLILMWELGKQLWVPSFFARTYGWQPAQIGVALGLLTLIFSSAGTASAGWVAEWLSKRGYRDANMRAALIAAVLALPVCVLAPLMPTATLSLLMFAPASFLGTFPFALAPATLSMITPNQMRAQVTALYLATINLLGAGLGPLYIGALTDHAFHQERLLKYSLSLTAVTVLPLAMLMLKLAMREYMRHLDGQQGFAVAEAV